jgi:hypothetical protein
MRDANLGEDTKTVAQLREQLEAERERVKLLNARWLGAVESGTMPGALDGLESVLLRMATELRELKVELRSAPDASVTVTSKRGPSWFKPIYAQSPELYACAQQGYDAEAALAVLYLAYANLEKHFSDLMRRSAVEAVTVVVDGGEVPHQTTKCHDVPK